MPNKRPLPDDDASTPDGSLGEARLHQIVGYQVAQAAIVANEVFATRVAKPLDLRPVEYTLLTLLCENPGSSPAQLSSALAVTRPNITAWVDKLVARRLVSRERNDSDKRGQRLRATPEGAALAAKATRALAEGERVAFHTLSYAERVMLTELLHKLARARGGRAVGDAAALEGASIRG